MVRSRFILLERENRRKTTDCFPSSVVVTMSFDEKYFSTHTYENISFARYSMYWWSNRFYAILARRYGKHGGRLLEIGSGMGHLVGQLEDSFETYGMDVNHWAVEQSKTVVDKSALQTASAEELPFEDGSFDVVIIKHIVEHLPNPEKAIVEIGRVTAPDGVLILATPNLDSLLKPWKGDSWIGYQDPTHISLHPPATWLDWIQELRFLPVTRLRRWLLGCALYPFCAEGYPEIVLWFAGGISGYNRFGLLADALGREYHGDCEETVVSGQ